MKCKEEERHGRVMLNVGGVTTLHHTLLVMAREFATGIAIICRLFQNRFKATWSFAVNVEPEVSVLLRCHAASLVTLPAFRDEAVVSYPRFEMSCTAIFSRKIRPLKIRSVCCIERSGTNYPLTHSHMPEERRPKMHLYENLEPYTLDSAVSLLALNGRKLCFDVSMGRTASIFRSKWLWKGKVRVQTYIDRRTRYAQKTGTVVQRSR